jgi:segregation and condensation protein B
MESWELKARIEALLVASDRPVTIAALAVCLEVSEDVLEAALEEYAADLMAADRGIQLRRRPHGLRLETKPQYADLVGRLHPERKSKPLTTQALETLAIIALKQPITLADISAIRGIESVATVETLRNRKLIARSGQLGPRRERIWRTTPLFLESFGLASIEEIYEQGRMEKIFASVYRGELGGAGADS